MLKARSTQTEHVDRLLWWTTQLHVLIIMSKIEHDSNIFLNRFHLNVPKEETFCRVVEAILTAATTLAFAPPPKQFSNLTIRNFLSLRLVISEEYVTWKILCCLLNVQTVMVFKKEKI